MKKKTKQIIIFIALVIIGIVYSVLYVLYPEDTKRISKEVLDYTFEKPLPVIGVSLVTLTICVRSVLSVTGIGNKSLSDCRKHLSESKEAQVQTRKELVAFEERVENKIDNFIEEHKKGMREICSQIPNKNVQELGEKLYGRKSENSETTEN